MQYEDLKMILLSCNSTGKEEDHQIYESRIYPKHIAERITEMMLDKQVYFGEIEGKHSEVFGVIEDHEIEIITKKEDINKFLLDNPTGVIFNHSFIDSFYDTCYDYGEEFEEEFKKLTSWVL
jgi:hypothetical protein